MKRFLRIGLVLAVVLNGCTSWRALDVGPVAADYDHVRLNMKDGSVVELKEVHASSDTLVGMRKGTRVGWRNEEEYFGVVTRVSVEDIATIETRQRDGHKTYKLVLGVIAIVGVAILAVWIEVDGSGF